MSHDKVIILFKYLSFVFIFLFSFHMMAALSSESSDDAIFYACDIEADVLSVGQGLESNDDSGIGLEVEFRPTSYSDENCKHLVGQTLKKIIPIENKGIQGELLVKKESKEKISLAHSLFKSGDGSDKFIIETWNLTDVSSHYRLNTSDDLYE